VPQTETGTITAPTLIIWCERDGLLSRGDEEAPAAAVRGSHLIVYDDSGHLVLWERPERVANDLTEFVQACPPDRGPATHEARSAASADSAGSRWLSSAW